MDSLKLHWHEWGFPGDYITHTHSTPIQIALDRGLPALGCYLWLIATLGMMLWRQYREGAVTDDLLPAALPLGSLGGVIGFFLSSLTNYNFGDSETLMLLLFFVALSLVTGRRGRSPADQESHR
jgi:O-antigen ligase